MSLASQLSLRQKTKNALERLDALESDLPRIVSSVNSAFTQVNQQVEGALEIVNAIIAILGEEAVTKAVTASREAKQAERVAGIKTAVTNMTTSGQLVAADAITETSLVTGVELDADGKDLPLTYFAIQFPQFKPEIKDVVLGKGIGFTAATTEGRSMRVDGVYAFAAPAVTTEAPTAPTTDAV